MNNLDKILAERMEVWCWYRKTDISPKQAYDYKRRLNLGCLSIEKKILIAKKLGYNPEIIL
ncbi:MAG: hypothetical protein LBS69_04025 [Prevotellaceae bacterium]|jgi:hypothetical protein|nr:hypothetical protein [Prevotellaceae bacterium]